MGVGVVYWAMGVKRRELEIVRRLGGKELAGFGEE